MKWLVLAALGAIAFAGYSLVGSTMHLAEHVNEFSSEHAVTTGAPKVLNAGAVPVTDGVAIFTVRCESEQPCNGRLTVALADPNRIGDGAYTLPAGATGQVGVLLPLGVRGTRGTLTWREATGATASARFKLKQGQSFFVFPPEIC